MQSTRYSSAGLIEMYSTQSVFKIWCPTSALMFQLACPKVEEVVCSHKPSRTNWSWELHFVLPDSGLYWLSDPPVMEGGNRQR